MVNENKFEISKRLCNELKREAETRGQTLREYLGDFVSAVICGAFENTPKKARA